MAKTPVTTTLSARLNLPLWESIRWGSFCGYTQQHTAQALYDLQADIGESTDVGAERPDVVARLEELAASARIELGDSANETTGTGYRPPAKLE